MALTIRLSSFLILFSIAQTTFAATYYISTSGSDSNSGTSTSTPWLHAPGMPGCTGNCKSKSPAAGDRFILRGGDTWHYNPAAGVQGLPWNIAGAGTSANPIYYGVDHSWYSGTAWNRPILTGDNPSSATAVSSCADGGVAGGNMVDASTSWGIIDDFELTGHCSNGPNSWFSDAYFAVDSNNTIFRNIYIHGWTHTAKAGSQMVGWVGSTDGRPNTWDSVVVDGFDSDPTSLCSLCFNGTVVMNSVFRNNSNQVISGLHILANNLYENITEPYDGAHGNLMEVNYEQNAGVPNLIYNNVFRNSPQIAVGVATCPSGNTDYVFNNVAYNIGTESWNYPGIPDATCSATGGSFFYNNSFSIAAIGDGRAGASRLLLSADSNLLFQTPFLPNSLTLDASNIRPTVDGAKTLGYVTTSNFVPSSADCNGNKNAATCPVGKGRNLTSSCSILNGYYAGAGDALCHDGTMGPNYDTAKHRVTGTARAPVLRPSSGAWDAGAFSSSNSSLIPSPPINLLLKAE